MSTIAPVRPETANPPDPETASGIVHEKDTEPRNMSCPMCGSGSTYQTMDGRWGCTQCGSSWA